MRSCVVAFNRAKNSNPQIDVWTPDDGAGGAIYLTGGGGIDIRDTLFMSNHAYVGGAIFRGPPQLSQPIADVTVTGCWFIRNRCFTQLPGESRARGGGALFERGTGVIRITNCEFHSCTADLSSGGDGGGGAMTISVPTACVGDCLECFECSSGCAFDPEDPACTDMSCEDCPTTVFVTNSVFSGNSGRGTGGGTIRCSRKALFDSCTIAWNEWTPLGSTSCGGWSATAGIVMGHQTHARLENCILYENRVVGCDPQPSLLQQQIAVDPTGGLGSYLFQYSDVEGLCISPCSPLSGNLSAPPMFAQAPSKGSDGIWGTADDSFGDLTLISGSPCADAGSDALVPPDDPFDLDRDGVFTEPVPVDVAYLTRRKEAGVGPVDQRVDMGAHELGCREDFNGDQTIDGTDLAFMLGAWTGAEAHYLPCPSFVQEDLDGNCRVDGFDLSLLLSAWGMCGVSGLSGGGGEAATSGGSTEGSGCEGEYELFLQWVASGDWDAFLQWYQCFMQLSGGS